MSAPLARSPSFEVVSTQSLQFNAGEPLRSMYQLSPFVWKNGDRYDVLLRGVPRRDDNPAEKISRVYYGTSRDGIAFDMDHDPVVAPGPGQEDIHGCEDPTFASESGSSYVYYTGWNNDRNAAQLMLAAGPDIHRLKKCGVVVASSAQRSNPKEATLARSRDGRWWLFYEFSRAAASCVGLAASGNVAGPWTQEQEPFEARADRWDSWHLSSGPVTSFDGAPLMFYNGADRHSRWRIGWIRFDPSFTRVIDRCDDPVVVPGAVEAGATDIAFAASALERGDETWLYYSVSDKDTKRCVLRTNSVDRRESRISQ